MHKLNPSLKLISVLIFIGSIISLQSPILLFLAYLGVIVLVIISKVPLKYIVSRTAVALPFIGLAALVQLFIANGQTLIVLSQSPTLVITNEGLWFALALFGRGFTAITIMLFLISTTKFIDLIRALENFKVPKIFVSTVVFSYRFIFLFIEDSQRLLRAKSLREFGTESYINKIKTLGGLIGNLFIRVYERAERVYYAMLARNFSGKFYSIGSIQQPLWISIIFSLFVIGLGVVLVIFDYMVFR